MKNKTEELKNELRMKQQECEMLHSEIGKRPIVVSKSCDLVSYENHKQNERIISQKINNGDEFYLNARKDDGVVTIRPFKYDGDIFYGLVVAVTDVTSIDVNEIVKFGSYDTYQGKNIMNTDFSLN